MRRKKMKGQFKVVGSRDDILPFLSFFSLFFLRVPISSSFLREDEERKGERKKEEEDGSNFHQPNSESGRNDDPLK